MLLADLVAVSATVGSTPSRSAKTRLVAEALRRAPADEVAVVVAYLSGELRQRRTGVGWATLSSLPPPAAAATLEVAGVDATFDRLAALSGPGSQARRRTLVADLFGRATADEQRFLTALVSGELRQGAAAGVMGEACILASGLPADDVRRALLVSGSPAAVTVAALRAGAAGLASFRLEVGRPLLPMLAGTAPTLADALARTAGPGQPAALEWKLDGVRVQVHRAGTDVRVFTRSLDDITSRLPEVTEAVAGLAVTDVVLDGEVLALHPDGRPRPFQVSAARAASRGDATELRRATPLAPFFFDVLHLDGADLLAQPGHVRAGLLSRLPAQLRIPRLVTADPAVATRFYADAVSRGHEGVVVKSLTAPYDAGRRGAGWVKVKPRHTLDLVVLAAEWGHGRRRGWLSNLHLGAVDPRVGGHVMLGKTFKGLTDAMLAWQTDRLLALQTGSDGHVVHVRPELVVEVAFDGVQTSSRYPGGLALRFARVLRHRPDKPTAEADTIDTVRALHDR